MEINTPEDAYTAIVTITGVPESVFFDEPWAFVVQVAMDKLAFDEFIANEQRKAMEDARR